MTRVGEELLSRVFIFSSNRLTAPYTNGLVASSSVTEGSKKTAIPEVEYSHTVFRVICQEYHLLLLPKWIHLSLVLVIFSARMFIKT
jgi:hypothetical protein